MAAPPRPTLTLAGVEIVHRHGAAGISGEDLARLLAATGYAILRDHDDIHNDLDGIAEMLRLIAHGIVESGDEPGPQTIGALYTLANQLDRLASDVLALPGGQTWGDAYDVRQRDGLDEKDGA